MDQASNLRKMVEKQKQERIEELISLGVYKLYDGRDLYEGTPTEIAIELDSAKQKHERVCRNAPPVK